MIAGNSGRRAITERDCTVPSSKTSLTLPSGIDLPGEQTSDMQQCEEALERAEATDPAPPRAALEAAKPDTRLAALTARQHGLFAILKAKRLEAARRDKLPAFVIFDDSVLIEMAVRCPATREDLLQIPGVGAMNVERYGATFLTAIANYRAAYE
jgi:superfamily II DNA helicase RecQ